MRCPLVFWVSTQEIWKIAWTWISNIPAQRRKRRYSTGSILAPQRTRIAAPPFDIDADLKKARLQRLGDDQVRAAQAIMALTIRDQAAFQANFDKQEAAFRSSGGVDDSYLRDGGARSAADHWDDMIRGLDTP
jgi:hypothetical protein